MKFVHSPLASFASTLILTSAFLVLAQERPVAAQEPVQLTETIESVPTYPFGLADKNPIFYTGRVYQGAQGRVYPYAMRDILSDEKQDQPYRLLYLENEYVKLGIAPGGSRKKKTAPRRSSSARRKFATVCAGTRRLNSIRANRLWKRK